MSDTVSCGVISPSFGEGGGEEAFLGNSGGAEIIHEK